MHVPLDHIGRIEYQPVSDAHQLTVKKVGWRSQIILTATIRYQGLSDAFICSVPIEVSGCFLEHCGGVTTVQAADQDLLP